MEKLFSFMLAVATTAFLIWILRVDLHVGPFNGPKSIVLGMVKFVFALGILELALTLWKTTFFGRMNRRIERLN